MPRDVHQNWSAIPEGGRSRRRPHNKPTLQYIVQTFEPAPSQKERPAPVPGADGTPDDLFTLGMMRVRSRVERRRRSSRASPVRRTLISLHVLLTFGRLNLPSVTGAGHQESPMVLETEDGIGVLDPGLSASHGDQQHGHAANLAHHSTARRSMQAVVQRSADTHQPPLDVDHVVTAHIAAKPVIVQPRHTRS
jgi:hypothetical protein